MVVSAEQYSPLMAQPAPLLGSPKLPAHGSMSEQGCVAAAAEKKHALCEKIKALFLRAKVAWGKFSQTRAYRTIKFVLELVPPALALGINGAKAVSETIKYFRINIVHHKDGVMHKIAEIAKKVLKINPTIINILSRIRVLAILATPFFVYETGTEVYKLIKAVTKKRVDDGLEAGLKIVENIGVIGDQLANFMMGLEAWNVIGAISWMPVVNSAALVISSAGAVSTAINIWFLHKLKKEVDIELDSNKDKELIEQFDSLVRLLKTKRKRYLKRHFHVPGKELVGNLEKISTKAREMIKNANDPTKQIEAEKKLRETMESLKKRLYRIQVSNAITVSAQAVRVIGIGLFFSPVVWLGFAFVAASSLVDFFRMFYNLRSDHHFRKALTAEF